MVGWGVEDEVADAPNLVPPEEVEAFTDEEESLLAVEERLSSAGDVLVRGVPDTQSLSVYGRHGAMFDTHSERTVKVTLNSFLK